jgi:hypothetical protein
MKLNQSLVRSCMEPTEQASEEAGGLGLPDATRVEASRGDARPAAPASALPSALKPVDMPSLASPPSMDDVGALRGEGGSDVQRKASV